jgi:hypothetical protein
MEDRSLDDFLGDDPDDSEGTVADESLKRSDERAGDDEPGDERAESGGTETDDAETDEESARVDPSTVEPAESTYAWSRDGGACAACGESVDRRWHADSGLVCVDCKEW